MFSCYRTYVRTLRRSNPRPDALRPPFCAKKAQGARRRNFSIRFPSGALINCGQFLKRRNEGTAAMHSSRAFLIGSRAHIRAPTTERYMVFYARYVLCKNSLSLSLFLSFSHGTWWSYSGLWTRVIICTTIASNLYMKILSSQKLNLQICDDNKKYCNCELVVKCFVTIFRSKPNIHMKKYVSKKLSFVLINLILPFLEGKKLLYK